MAETAIGTANPLAIKHFSVTLHSECLKESEFLMMMSGPIPKESAALAKKEKVQSVPSMPIVTIHDLEKMAGDRVTCDMFKTITGLPFMGDEKMEGQGGPLGFSTDELKINQTRFPISPGSKMSQKRTTHNLRRIARAELAGWFGRLNDQQIMVHLAGARGTENTEDWVVPLRSHPKFAAIMVNPVLAPTRNRRFIAGGADTIADITTTNALRLEDLDEISSSLTELPFPPAPIEIKNLKGGGRHRMWCLFVTIRQWHYILTSAGGSNTNTWREFLAKATQRLMLTQHPLFNGETGVWRNLIIKTYPRAVRWKAGESIMETQTNGSESAVKVPSGVLAVDRAILVGGQALAIANGSARGMGSNGFPTSWSEKLLDHDNTVEIGAAKMDGMKKLRFEGSDGAITDFGTAVIDSYAPIPASAKGRDLVEALQK